MEGRSLTAKIAEFKAHLISEERSAATVEKYIRDVKAFAEYAQNKGITKETVIAYKKHLQRNYAVRSVNSMLASLNSFGDACLSLAGDHFMKFSNVSGAFSELISRKKTVAGLKNNTIALLRKHFPEHEAELTTTNNKASHTQKSKIGALVGVLIGGAISFLVALNVNSDAALGIALTSLGAGPFIGYIIGKFIDLGKQE